MRAASSSSGRAVSSAARTTVGSAPARTSASTASVSRFVPGPAITIAPGRVTTSLASTSGVGSVEGPRERGDGDGREAGEVEGRFGADRAEQHGGAGSGEEGGDVAGTDFDDVATARLGEQGGRLVPMGQRVDHRTEATGDAQLGEGDDEAALADVVARLHEAVADRPVQAAVAGRGVGIGLRGGADTRG